MGHYYTCIVSYLHTSLPRLSRNSTFDDLKISVFQAKSKESLNRSGRHVYDSPCQGYLQNYTWIDPDT